MTHLEDVTAADLRAVLADVEGKQATQRVMVGISYKNGITQTELAEWYGVERKTIYNWLTRLDRLADEPPEDVVYDAPRPGRPAKLTAEQRDSLDETLHADPEDAGIDAPAWEPVLVQRYIAAAFGVEYSRRHVRELMHDAGLSWDTTRSHRRTADERVEEAFADGPEESPSE